MTKEEIKDNRQRLGLTQQALAEAIGHHSRSQVSEWESGKRKPSPENIKKLEKIFKSIAV